MYLLVERLMIIKKIRENLAYSCHIFVILNYNQQFLMKKVQNHCLDMGFCSCGKSKFMKI